MGIGTSPVAEGPVLLDPIVSQQSDHFREYACRQLLKATVAINIDHPGSKWDTKDEWGRVLVRFTNNTGCLLRSAVLTLEFSGSARFKPLYESLGNPRYLGDLEPGTVIHADFWLVPTGGGQLNVKAYVTAEVVPYVKGKTFSTSHEIIEV